MARQVMSCGKHGSTPVVRFKNRNGEWVLRCERCAAEELEPGRRLGRELRLAEMRRRIGSTQNPPPGPLSQGGDT